MSTLANTAEAAVYPSLPSADVNEPPAADEVEGQGARGECNLTRHGDAISRWTSAILFWALCLLLSAAGHWVYVTFRTLDRNVSSEFYRSPGRAIVWVGHGDLEQSVSHTQAKFGPPLQSLTSPTEEPTTLPLSPFWSGVGISFALLAIIAVWSSQWIGNGGIQSLVGLLAGHAIWIGAVEIGLDLASRSLGLTGAIDIVSGRVAGVHGSAVLIQLSAIFLLPIFVGLSLHESNRCAVFQWFRRRLPITKYAGASGRVDNYAARTMVQFFMTVWVCYVAVLWMADPSTEIWGHVALLVTLAAIAFATPYMIWRSACQTTHARMLRYSVSGAVITWTGIEIASATGMVSEPWLDGSPGIGAILVGGCVVLTSIAAMKLTAGRYSRREAFQ